MNKLAKEYAGDLGAFDPEQAWGATLRAIGLIGGFGEPTGYQS